ncbi:hypothetical protein [Winogradskyella psychrotolerans]|uniref:hypothetical protein n=1 Tax=Winogradskyella psychrotolerans TaxID=1344585 RepID=UPI001C070302|nr:hypothetical protein [Winogradskyella psychrotolerans]MBU2929749.1 hypothetical protein [Winogradskyella psychrotolerans]
MISLHHSLNFWNNADNWVQPQNFDTLFKVLLAIYFIITFVPDFVKYFRVSSLMRSAQIRKYSFKMLEELVNSLEKENITKKNLFLSTYTNFLNGMDFSFVQIEEKLFRVWKKYIIFHLIVIITSIGYLFFGAYSDNNILVHRQIVSISLLILLLPFIFSIVSAFKAIKPDVEIARN